MAAEGITLTPYVPIHLRRQVIASLHDDPCETAHLGEAKTLARLQQHYYWPGMTKSVQSYIYRCRACQLAKKHRTKQAGLLKPIPVAGALPDMALLRNESNEIPRDPGP